MEQEQRMLSVEQAAKYIGLAPKTLRNRMCRNAKNPISLKHKKIGGRTLFDIKDLDEYCNSLPYEE